MLSGGFSLSESLYLCLVNFTSASQSLQCPLTWNRIAKLVWSWVLPFAQVSYALIKQDRLWLIQFLLRVELLGTECFGIFHNGSFSPSLA